MSGSHAETEPNNDLIRTDSKLSPKTGGEDSETTYYGGGAKEKLSPVVEDSECHVGEFAVSSASLNPCLKLDFILSAIEAEYLDHSTSLDPENHDPKVIPDEEDYDYRQQPDCEKPHPYKLRKPAGLSVRIPNKSNKSGVDQDERLQSTFFSSLQHHQPSRQDSKDMKHNHRTVACIKENQQRHHHANAQLIRQDRDPYRDRGSPPPTAPTNNSREPNRGFEENQRKSKRVSLSAGAVILAPIDLYEKPIQIRLHGSRSSHSGPSSVKSLGEEKSDNLSSDDNVRRSGSSEKKKRNGIGRSAAQLFITATAAMPGRMAYFDQEPCIITLLVAHHGTGMVGRKYEETAEQLQIIATVFMMKIPTMLSLVEGAQHCSRPRRRSDPPPPPGDEIQYPSIPRRTTTEAMVRTINVTVTIAASTTTNDKQTFMIISFAIMVFKAVTEITMGDRGILDNTVTLSLMLHPK
ncbi:hypothetical protein HK102_002037 [Quaeritorhiza haematococci]|nr:hypothetical protein HK102_002037 [Quaeritorhiza haematococci]